MGGLLWLTAGCNAFKTTKPPEAVLSERGGPAEQDQNEPGVITGMVAGRGREPRAA